MGYSKVGKVIIYPRTSRTLLFLRTTQPFHVTKVIICPNNSDIFRQLQTIRINIQYLFIGSKCLGNGFDRLINMLGYQIPLILQCTLQHLYLLFHRHIATSHGGVM